MKQHIKPLLWANVVVFDKSVADYSPPSNDRSVYKLPRLRENVLSLMNILLMIPGFVC